MARCTVYPHPGQLPERSRLFINTRSIFLFLFFFDKNTPLRLTFSVGSAEAPCAAIAGVDHLRAEAKGWTKKKKKRTFTRADLERRGRYRGLNRSHLQSSSGKLAKFGTISRVRMQRCMRNTVGVAATVLFSRTWLWVWHTQVLKGGVGVLWDWRWIDAVTYTDSSPNETGWQLARASDQRASTASRSSAIQCSPLAPSALQPNSTERGCSRQNMTKRRLQ